MKAILLAAAAMIAVPTTAIAQDTPQTTTAPDTGATTADPAADPNAAPMTPQADPNAAPMAPPADPAATAPMAPAADPAAAAPMAPAADPAAGAPMTPPAGGAMGTESAGGYQPSQPAVSGTPQPGATVRFQPAPSPSQAFPPPAAKESYPVCKKGQYDGCMQASDRKPARRRR